MERRIFVSLLSTGAVMIILTLAAALAVFKPVADRQVFEMLRDETEIAAAAYNSGSKDVYHLFGGMGDRRVTIVEANGSVLFDTYSEAELPSHLDRPEIEGALKDGSASEKRSSETFGRTLYYYAVRLNDGGVIRLSIESGQVWTMFIGSVIFMLFIAAMLLIAAVFISRWLTTRITEPVRKLAAELDGIGATPETDPAYPEFKPMLDKIRFQQKEIKRQLARVQKEKDRIAAIINNMDEGLVILSPELRVIMLNDSAYKYLRVTFPKSECGGMLLTEVCGDEAIMNSLMKCESKMLVHDGRELQLHVKQIESSEQLGRIGLILDVTERAEIDRIKQEFTANVSHELKTPLTSISGYAEMIENGMAKEGDIPLFAGRIRRESDRMLTLISDIIKLSKLDSEKPSEAPESVDLLAVCRECVDMLDISAKRHDVTVGLEGEECRINGSTPELTELVYNLIDNSIRYNHAGGRVDVKLISAHEKLSGKYEGARAVLSVSDTGIGIPAEHLSRIFERFYRVDKSRSKETGGTGLGLAIVKHVAERHGAKLEVESEPGRGTTIRVIF